AGDQPEFLERRGDNGADERTDARSHRLRGCQSQGLLWKARGSWRETRRAVRDARGRHCHGASHRSLGHVDRTDGRPAQVACGGMLHLNTQAVVGYVGLAVSFVAMSQTILAKLSFGIASPYMKVELRRRL